MQKPLIFDIQRFSLHDGDGIRTTVFFKGCPLRCRWCHNPESQRFEAEWMFFEERCINCGRCRAGELTAETCPTGARELTGRTYELDELMRLLLRDRLCYEDSGGGVTLSGGEVMAQPQEYVLSLVKRLHAEDISVNIDTSGYASWDRFEAILPYVDAFLYDIKCFSGAKHSEYTGVDNALILDNAQKLTQHGAKVNVRVPVIPGVNDEGEMESIITFVAGNIRPYRVNLLPYHALGAEKRRRLGSGKQSVFEVPGAADMERMRRMWIEAGVTDVRIGG